MISSFDSLFLSNGGEMLKTQFLLRNRFALSLLSVLSVASMACCSAAALSQDDEDKRSKVEELIQDARDSLTDNDYAKAAGILAEAVKVDPKSALAWQLHGYALHADGKLDAAIKSHKKAAEFDSTRGVALYNLGCAYSLKKELKTAMDYLDKAIDAGFLQTQYFETDTDLDNLRKEKRFKEIVAIVKNGGRKAADKKADKDKAETTDKKDSKKFKAKAIVGNWKVVAGQRSGEKIPAERLPPSIKITKKEITIPTGDAEPFVFSYKIDSSKSPATIDLKIEGGPVPEGQAVGILKFEKKKLVLCYESTGQKRPKEFKTKADDGCFMFEMERIKSEKKDKKDKKESKDKDNDF